MNPEKNIIPSTVKRIHLTAVCGTGMGALACVLKKSGCRITGSDQNVYPPISTLLAENGIMVQKGFSPNNLAYRPDLVVIGNVVTRNNPEAAAVKEMGLHYCSMPQAVNHFMAGGKHAYMITGTHGKTTTSALLTWMLESSGSRPSFLIGGILNNFSQSSRLGDGNQIVLEGDEYDTAFFDKGPKFMHYRPKVTVLTGIEFDHADIYRDFDHVKETFTTLVKRLPPSSRLVAFSDDPAVREVLPRSACPVITYGFDKSADWRVKNVSINPPWMRFDVYRSNVKFGRFKTRMMGRHNLSNILGAMAAADQAGISDNDIAESLVSFKGIKRRQEKRGIRRGVTVLDDFAHHPTAVRETILAAKPFFPKGRLIAVFEPRTNTSLRNVFQEVYPKAFSGADIIVVRQPTHLDKVPENERFSTRRLVETLRVKYGKHARLFDKTDHMIDFIVSEAENGDVVLVMSNGGFDNIHDRLLAAL